MLVMNLLQMTMGSMKDLVNFAKFVTKTPNSDIFPAGSFSILLIFKTFKTGGMANWMFKTGGHSV